ncbi:MAG: hypothetical protein IH628_03830 [Proteobacteria bacterium]|nr:hypothetical protein [Pseudomonadota bacterium]
MDRNATPHRLLTVRQFVEQHPFITEAALRFLIFRSRPRRIGSESLPANGLAPAFPRIGRRVYVAPETFFSLITPHPDVALQVGNESKEGGKP